MKPSRAAEGSLKDFYQTVSFLLPDFRKFLVNRSVVSLVYESLKLVPVYLVKLIIDEIIPASRDFNTIAMLIGILLLTLILLTSVEMASFGYVLKKMGKFQREVLENIHKKLMNLPLSFHERQNTGAVVSKINKAANYVGEMLWFLNNDIIPTIFQIILTSALLVITKWEVGAIYLVSLPIILYMVITTNKKAQPYRHAYHQSFDLATGELAQSLYNVKTVKDYLQEKREHESYSKTLKQYAENLLNRGKIELWGITWRETFSNVVRAATMIISVLFVFNGKLTIGDLVLIFTLTEKAFMNVHRLGRVYNFLGDAQESLSRAKRILTERNMLENPQTPKEAKEKAGTIMFKDVNFSYGPETVLRKVNLKIPSKKIVAVIGESGSGKSTMIKLITRHYDATSGGITLDNIDLKDMVLNKLRKRIAVVSQHSEIFNRTIKENIAYGKPNATKNEVIEAAKKANAHDFIMKLKNKYETLVGEKGVRLSGGQQQRLSIARALLTKPEILIFDEATSSLDTESELKIQEALFGHRGERTMIIIAHRLSTIENADLVVVMSKGRIAEIGTHKELLNKKDGLYRKMRKLQRLGELRA